jgi:hypothetical protein
MEGMLRAKVAAAVVAVEAGGSEPTAAELAAINRFALEPLEASEVYVRQVRLATDAYDRTWERLPRVYLERLAQTLPGKPLLLGHDHRETPTGLWFAATVRRAAADEPGEWVLDAGFYLRKSEANAEIRRQIDAGVIRYASIGFRHDGVQCDVCGAVMDRPGGCEHWPGREVNGQAATFTYAGNPEHVEAHEGSLVYLGAQYGAELVKELGASDEATGEEFTTETRRTQRGYGGLEGIGGGPEPELKALAEDGQAYRVWLRAELARLAGIVRAEAEAGLLLSALEGQPVAKWLPVIASFQARVEALLPAAPHGRWPSPPDPLSQDWERGNRTGERVVRPVRLA